MGLRRSKAGFDSPRRQKMGGVRRPFSQKEFTMEIRNLYERVVRRRKIDTTDFLDAYNEIVLELCMRFGDKYVLLDGAVRTDAVSLNGSDAVLDVYAPAIADGIMWRLTGEGRELYDAEAVQAFRRVHMTRAYGKVLNIRRTNVPYPIIRGAEKGEINASLDDDRRADH